MKVRSWLATTCSTTTTTATTATGMVTSSNSSPTTSTSSSSSPSSSNSSLQSNLSLQTLPSVPSLQKLTSDTHHISYLSTASLKPNTTNSNNNNNLQITSFALHNNLLYTSSGHTINVYDRTTCTYIHSFNANRSSSGSVKSITFSNGKIFTAHQDSKIRVWKLLNKPQDDHHYKLLTVLPTVNDRLANFILPKNYINVRRHKKTLWIQHADAVSSLAVNNGFIYSVSWDKYLKIWRASDLRCLESVKAHDDAINAVVVSVDGTVYTGSADCRIRVWSKPVNEKKHCLVATLEKHKSAVNALALNDDGSVLFSGACDRSILVWEREDSANHMVVIGALRGHTNAILCLINVSDLLFSGSADRTVRIWKRGCDGKYCCLSVLEGHNKPVKSLAAVFEDGSSDDNNNSNQNKNGVVSVFSGSLDGEIKVWQVSLLKNL